MLTEYAFAIGAGETKPFDLPAGRFTSWTLLESSAGSHVYLSFDDSSNRIKARPGDGDDRAPFTRLLFASDVAQTFRIRFSQGQQRTGQAINVTTTATVESANTCKALTDVVALAGLKTLIAAANANRNTVIIKSRSANTTAGRLGDNATVAENAGVEIDPGETATFDTEAAVYCHNASASNITFTITELERI